MTDSTICHRSWFCFRNENAPTGISLLWLRVWEAVLLAAVGPPMRYSADGVAAMAISLEGCVAFIVRS